MARPRCLYPDGLGHAAWGIVAAKRFRRPGVSSQRPERMVPSRADRVSAAQCLHQLSVSDRDAAAVRDGTVERLELWSARRAGGANAIRTADSVGTLLCR